MRLQSKRPGNVIAMMGVSIFGLMGIAALAIDLGFASLSRREMQTAVDTAALEGLRARDDPRGATIARQNASLFSALVFDDDLDPENGDPLHLGAGPIINYQGGIPLPGTTFLASRLITADSLGVYKPQQANGNPGLELNLTNDQAGDMVSGNYDPTTADHSEQPSTSPTPYARADFTPAATGNTAFLVRMRRTGETFAAGVGSAGPPLPSIFGRAMMPGDRQERGTFVRATAIAQATPVKSAGPTSPSMAPAPVAGVTPLGLDATFWQSLPFGPSTATINPATGEIDGASGTVGWITQVTALATAVNAGATTLPVASTAGFPVTFPFHVRIDLENLLVTGAAGTGWTVTRDPTQAAAHLAGAAVRLADPTVIGQPFAQGTFNGFATALDPAYDHYVPLFTTIGSQGSLIVGFGYAQLAFNPTSNQLTITKMDQIALANASGILAIPIGQVNPALAPADIENVFTANASLTAANPGNALRAPALVRAVP